MSWQGARKDAQLWLDTLNLPTRSLKGQTINLSEQAGKLRGEPKYVAMIIRAATRILFARGVVAIIDEPKAVDKLLGELEAEAPTPPDVDE